MTAAERIREALAAQGKALDFEILRDKERPAPDGVPRRQLVELAAEDILEVCGPIPVTQDKVCDALRKGSSAVPAQDAQGEPVKVFVQVRDVLHLLKIAGGG
jgi:hypothetical protein